MSLLLNINVSHILVLLWIHTYIFTNADLIKVNSEVSKVNSDIQGEENSV